MLIHYLDGGELKWKPKGTNGRISGLQHLALDVLRELYPTLIVLTEVTLPITRLKKLRADLMIPTIPLVIEVHGKQHYSFSKFMHRNQREFNISRHNDQMKRNWLELNEIELVELKYDEQDKWGSQITAAIR